MIRLVVLLCCCSFAPLWSAVEKQSPVWKLPVHRVTEAQEVHGTVQGQRFWIRIHPPKVEYGNGLLCELLYTPASEQELGGAYLGDHPFILLDKHYRLIAWNERAASMSSVEFRGGDIGYAVTREVIESDESKVYDRTLAGSKAWSLQLVPILLAVVAEKEGNLHIPVRDFLGLNSEETLTATVNAGAISISGYQELMPSWDSTGRLSALNKSDGTSLLSVTARKTASTGWNKSE